MQVVSAVKNNIKVLMVVCKGLEVYKYPTVNGKLQMWYGIIKDTSRLDSEGIVTVSWGENSTDELFAELKVRL